MDTKLECPWPAIILLVTRMVPPWLADHKNVQGEVLLHLSRIRPFLEQMLVLGEQTFWKALNVIIRNKIIDLIRSQERHKYQQMSELAEIGDLRSSNEFERCDARDFSAWAESEICPPHYWRILLSRCEKGVKETAEAFGMSEAVVRQYCRMARFSIIKSLDAGDLQDSPSSLQLPKGRSVSDDHKNDLWRTKPNLRHFLLRHDRTGDEQQNSWGGIGPPPPPRTIEQRPPHSLGAGVTAPPMTKIWG